ncbi:MAG TPA: sigma-70 family RNA polymerase sigma factor [Solirubrobacteraceae bacterium]
MAALIPSALLRTQTDKRLVALAADGSEPAFEALVERYRKPLQSYCRRMLLPAEAAEDVVQQAFLSTWQALRRGTEVRDARAWLYRVTHNAAVNALRRSGYDHDQLDDALHGAGAPEEDLERRIAIRRTLAGLAALPEMQREALLRTAVEGQSHEEVARELGLSDGAVRGLVYRARATLRTAATALTPAPVAQWAASVGSSDVPLTERVAEIVAGGGTAGASALLVKGGATLLAAGALAGGAAVVEKETGSDRGEARTDQAAQTVASDAPARIAAAEEQAGLEDADEERGRSPGHGRGRAGTAGRDEREDRRGRRGGGDDDRDRSGSSGPGSGDDDSGSGSGSSGSGSGDDDDTSGSGSGSSGSGSGDDSSGSGSGSSGSGSGDDSSGSGSGDSVGDSSGSGSADSGGDSSGSGSSGSDSGSGDSSGSGSSGSGSGDSVGDVSDSSGSGSSGSGSSGSGSEDRSGSGSGTSTTSGDG